jgi:SAM-dependent methyltransferase
VYLVARERSTRWPTDLLRSGVADLEFEATRIRGSVELVVDPAERGRILELFRARYGVTRFARYYERPARILRVRRDGGQRLAPSERYYRWLESEFDYVADDYDQQFSANRMSRWLRDRSLSTLRRMFSRPSSLIEIGCGSGVETLPMLRAGHELLVVDLSERMLEVVRRKARAEGLAERLRTVRRRASEIGSLEDAAAEVALSGGYSTFGAMNCEADLSPVAAGLTRTLPPGSPFLAGVFNRWCLFELAGYSLTLQPRRAFSRRQRPIAVGDSRFGVDFYAYSVMDVRAAFQPGFQMAGVEGLPVLLPPSDLVRFAERYSRHFELLARVDQALGARFPMSYLGDHFLLELRRGSSDARHPTVA